MWHLFLRAPFRSGCDYQPPNVIQIISVVGNQNWINEFSRLTGKFSKKIVRNNGQLGSDYFIDNRPEWVNAINRPFAGSSHIVRNKLYWDANNAVGLPKQRNSYQSSATFLNSTTPTNLKRLIPIEHDLSFRLFQS